jgi:tetratricopeptide (TPR) repeat protein
MKRDSMVFVIAGTFFGILIGWILGSQAPRPGSPTAPAFTTVQGPAEAPSTARPLDVQRAADLERQANASPRDAAVRVQLGNLYFDSERYDLAAPMYEAALAIDPSNVDASTDLAVSYYYTGQVDRALAQIDRSLSVDPDHVKTLFNQGVIRAGGKEDLAGAATSLERVVQLAPQSAEGVRARELLENIAQHSTFGATSGSGSGG